MGRLLLIPIVLLAMLVASMFWSGRSEGEPADFVFFDRGDVRNLDPNRMSWMEDIRLGYGIFEGLYALDPQTLNAVPGTAGRIDISPDGTVYTFHIRPNAGWTNGDPVLAEDFVFAWKRMMDQPGDYTYLLDFIVGAKAYRAAVAEGKPADFSAVKIEVLDSRTLRVTLEHPVPYFLDICAFPPTFPLNRRSMERFRKVDPQTGRETYDNSFVRPPHFVTNGPYRLASWEFKKRVRLVANEHYWDRANVKSRVIDRLIIEDNKLGEFLRYETGVVDWLSDMDTNIAAELLARGRRNPLLKRDDLKVFPAFGTYFYSFNCLPKFKDGRDNPFKDLRVRRAFALAVDKQPIVETITRMGERIADHYVPPGSLPGYLPPERGLVHNPSEARRLLAEAGFPGGRGFPPLKLLFNTGSRHGEVAQQIRRQWRDKLGVTLELEPVESAIFSERLHNQEYDIARASWFGDYRDVSTFADKFLANSDNNDAKWVNPEYDRLCYAAAREQDHAARMEMYRRAEQILLDEAPLIPIYYYVNTFMFRENVRGIPLDPRNMVVLKAVHKVKTP